MTGGIQQVLDAITDAPAWVRNARHDMLADHVQNRGGEPPRDAHFLLLFRGLDGDVHRLRNGGGAVRRQEVLRGA